MANPIVLTLPPGRLVKGSLYNGSDKDAEGQPLVVKNGPNKGQPRVDFYCEVAISKTGEQSWAHTDWGRQLFQIGAVAFPAQSQRPDFAWKVIDGDSTIPNKNGKKPCDQAGYRGCWVIRLSSGYKSPVVTAQNGQWVQQPQEGFVNLGDYVQANVTVNDNGSQQQAGIYVNHRMFAFIGYGERIVTGPDANSAGFTMGALPPGASATPSAGMPMPLIPGLPPAPGAPAPLAPPAAPYAPPVAPGVGYAPAAAAMPAPPTPSAPPAAIVTASADPLVPVPGAAHSIASLRAANWSDDQIVAGGFATRVVVPAVPAPLPPGISAPAPGVPAAPIAPAIPVTPNPGFATIPAPPGAPAAPIAPPAGPTLTAAGVAAGGSYDAFRSQGWQDDQLRAAGYLA